MATQQSRDAQLDTLRSGALDRLQALEDSMVQLRADRGADSPDDEHDPEGVTLSSEWARLVGLRSAAQHELDEVDEAIARLKSGADGICVDCGRRIPAARLRARPTATRCVDCAARAEA